MASIPFHPGVAAEDLKGRRYSIRKSILLVILLVAVPLLYLPYAWHNLPVAANVDERTSLEVLERFHHGSLNPQFFMYPTLYYYITYLFVSLFGFAKVLFVGRLLNVAFVGLTAFVTYLFCADHLRSAAAGIIAALCVVSSPTIINSGAYLCTDVLLAVTTMASLHALTSYFARGDLRSWWIGMLLLGAAVGCKYTAFLLFIAYCIAEVITNMRVSRRTETDTSRYFARGLMVSGLVTVGILMVAGEMLFPASSVLEFVRHTRSNVNWRSDAEYLIFFQHIRRLLEAGGGFFILLAALVFFSKTAYECLARKRMYAGFAIVLFVSYLSTPYSLIDPKHFLYDLGALARSNVVVSSGQSQWSHYAGWLMSNETPALLLLSVAGMVVVARRVDRSFVLVGVYLLLYIYVIGSAHVGFARYLTPLLPLLYCATGAALVSLWRRKASTPWPKVATAAVCLLVAIQVVSRGIVREELTRETDALYASYQIALEQSPKEVLYAGYAPSVELEESGLHPRPVSWASLAEHGPAALLHCGQLLIFDKRAAAIHHVEAAGDAGVTSLLDDPRGDGQEVLSRSDCH